MGIETGGQNIPTKPSLTKPEVMKEGFNISKLSNDTLNKLNQYGVRIENGINTDGEPIVRLNSDKKFIIDLEHRENGQKTNYGKRNDPLELDRGVKDIIVTPFGSSSFVIMITNKDGSTDIAILEQTPQKKLQGIEQTQNQPNLSFMKDPDGNINTIGIMDNINILSRLMRTGYRFNPQEQNSIAKALLSGRWGKNGYNKVDSIAPTIDEGIEVTLRKDGLTMQETQIQRDLEQKWRKASEGRDYGGIAHIQEQIDELKRPKQQILYINQQNWRNIL